MMIPNILMLVGGLAWLAGELFGVYRNETVQNSGRDTTSQWVWFVENKFPIVRVFLGVFLVSLVGHLLFGTWLLP